MNTTTTHAVTAAELTAEAEQLAREFARAWPTPNVIRAIRLCEAGTIAWADVAALFARSYGKAKADVA